MDKLYFRAFCKGTLSLIPGLYRFIGGTGGTCSARYCYTVWMRHLILAVQHGLPGVPEAVAELGPGDSIGTGLSALLSGANRYLALDVFPYPSDGRNLAIFDELVSLFESRAPLPGDEEFPRVYPKLQSYAFPHEIVTDERLAASLQPERLAKIRGCLSGAMADGAIRYVAPWNDARTMERQSVDLIISQAVMEHVDDLEHTYRCLHDWLKPGGMLSQDIDFSCHGLSAKWSGHWGFSKLKLGLARGGRPWLLNRQPHSAHVALLGKYGFDIVHESKTPDPNGIARAQLHRDFAWLSDEDLTTRNCLLQAIRR